MNKEDKGKIRVFLFELEGTNETLLESVRSITGALKGTFTPPARTIQVLPKLTSPANGESQTDQVVIELPEEVESDESSPETKPIPKTKKQRRYPTPNVIDLDLTSGDLPLKMFCEQKKPKSHNAKYLVISAWLSEQRSIEEVTADHIYTAYKLMKWTVPTDPTQILRNLQGEGLFKKGSSDATFAINHLGLNRVQEMEAGA